MAKKSKKNSQGSTKMLFAIAVVIAVASIMIMADSAEGKKGGGNAINECRDSIDNDGDGLIDSGDPGCNGRKDKSELNPGIECDDGIDNDGDGLADISDNGCTSVTDPDETNCGDGICEGGETSFTCAVDCGLPDTCTDSDGGYNLFIQGTASGIQNGQPFSHKDTCVTTSRLMEYYCLGSTLGGQQSNCPVSNITGLPLNCGDGACV